MGNYNLKSCVIFDIDGTLSNMDHRRCYVNGSLPGGKKNFKKFYEEMDKDSVYEDMVGTVNSYFMHNWEVMFCTGRPEAYREITRNWLNRYGILAARNGRLIMRPDNKSHIPDFEWKETVLHELKGEGYHIHRVYEDRTRVVKMWRRNGIRCLQVCDDDGDPLEGVVDGF